MLNEDDLGIGDFDDDPQDNDVSWKRVPTVEERALHKAHRAVENLYKDRRCANAFRGPQGFEIDLEPLEVGNSFSGCSLSRVFEEEGSILGPTLWNVSYNGVLQVESPEGVETVAYADDLAIVVRSRSEEGQSGDGEGHLLDGGPRTRPGPGEDRGNSSHWEEEAPATRRADAERVRDRY